VLHDLSVGADLSNVYILNGRKTLPYQQLSHSNDVKVWLRSSSTSETNHIYRFDGEDGQLMRFSCDDTYQ
jgi:hypothetical protein